MPGLDHVNLTVVDGPRMVRFLEQVLDAREGFRPDFGFPGHWIYLDDKPVIHLNVVERAGDFPEGIVNHIAFGVYESEEAKSRVEASGYPWKLGGIPGTPIGQIFVTGPEGLVVEIQYRH
jgi:catechol 2,3-dioxygenase-like lactoylglutathione lyase family enzyme